MSVTVSFGVNNSVQRDPGKYDTVRDLIEDPQTREFLGYGDAIDVTRGCVEVNLNASPVDGDTYEVSTRSGDKG